MGHYRRHGYEHPCRDPRFRKRWESFRRGFLAKNPACASCGRAANSVDHITPLHKIAPWDKITAAILLNASNCQPLCSACHWKKTTEDNRRIPRRVFCRCYHAYKDGEPVCGQPACIADHEAEINSGRKQRS